MKWLLAFAFVGIFSSAVGQSPISGISPATRQVLLGVLKNIMNNAGPPSKPPSPPMQPFRPPSPFLPPPFSPPMGPPPMQAPPPGMGGGLFMDIPQSHGGYSPYAAAPVFREYCPPGPTTADHCKDQKLRDALYLPNGKPRYNWVPPSNPWDTSLPDTVKDMARNILMMKVNSRPGRQPTPKEWELMSLLGDPKEQGPAHANPFAMG